MIKRIATVCLFAAAFVGAAAAQEGPVPKGIPHLDHVFVTMMENHSYSQVVGNPDDPFVNKFAKSANMSTNYFAVAHPSLTNYLEVVGGSNFNILNDDSPDWHDASCTPNIISGVTAFDTSKTPPNCPIWGTGTDAATPLIDTSNETTPPSITAVTEIDGKLLIPADPKIVGKTIADQLAAVGLTWKSYQEDLPPSGADNLNYSDGFFTDATDFATALPGTGLTSSSLVDLYAVKHNPFVYFRSVQEGYNPRNSLANVVDFGGPHGLFADLISGRVPNFSFIAPNQCDDQHGRGNAGPVCEYDPNDNGTQNGLNPGLMYRGDVSVQTLVSAIHNSPAWQDGNSAIVLLWDENDYSAAPNVNQVLLVVDTNYGVHGVSSSRFYTHFSLLKSIEAGFSLPCLNHACDSNEQVMTDLFAPDHGDRGHNYFGH
jgi:phosphatidylinositol-3-phosphatase